MAKLKVIVVDDQVFVREQIVTALAVDEHEIEILQADNGLRGLALFEQNPDVTHLLVDLHMPDMDGMAMLRQLHTSRPERMAKVAVFVITTESDTQRISEFRRWGVKGWLPKPLQVANIRRYVLDAAA